jgi:hypothetical protein
MDNNPFQHNPILEQEDYFKQYKESIDKMRNDPTVIEFDKLTYELFKMNEQGKRWMEIITQRYLIPALAKPGTATYQLDIMWAEGFKDFPRMILMAIQAHDQKIQAEMNNDRRK